MRTAFLIGTAFGGSIVYCLIRWYLKHMKDIELERISREYEETFK